LPFTKFFSFLVMIVARRVFYARSTCLTARVSPPST
jgi:hypothetical protein